MKLFHYLQFAEVTYFPRQCFDIAVLIIRILLEQHSEMLTELILLSMIMASFIMYHLDPINFAAFIKAELTQFHTSAKAQMRGYVQANAQNTSIVL